MSNRSTLPRWCERISLFTKPTAGAKANTIWFGIVQMEKLNKLDVFKYFQPLLTVYTQRNTPDIEAYLPGAPEIQATCRA